MRNHRSLTTLKAKLATIKLIEKPRLQGISPSRALAFIGLFSALYIVSGGLVGLVLQEASRYPEHFLRGLLMSGVVISTRRMWSATMMGLVTGIIFVLAIPAPAPYLLPSSLVAGLVFDLIIRSGSSYAGGAMSRRRIMTAAAVSGAAESIIVLTFLYSVGVLKVSGTVLGFIFTSDVALNVILSIFGAGLALGLLIRRRNPTLEI